MQSIRNSVCPHDCPSTCALEVEVLDGTRIGAVHGAAGNSYTAGVICNKVSRYAERIHHPDRLTHPLLRTGPKGSGEFRRITWDEALDRVAGAFADVAAKHGNASGLAVLLCRHDGPGAARRHQPAAARDALLAAEPHNMHVAAGGRLAGRHRPEPRRRSARDGEIRPDRGVGRQSRLHAGQRDDAHHARAKGAWREAGGGRSVSLAERGGSGPAPRAAPWHRRRAGLRRDARRLPRRLRRPRLHGALRR